MDRTRRTWLAAAASALAAAGVAGVLALTSPATAATIPFGQVVTGRATYYDDAGYGACGTQIDAGEQMLVAVSHTYWTTANPNVDPLCAGVSVQVSYGRTTLTLPVVDKCPSCDATHLDLSKPAFEALADPDLGVIEGLSWTFVQDGGVTASTSASPPGTTPAPVTSAPVTSDPVTSDQATSGIVTSDQVTSGTVTSGTAPSGLETDGSGSESAPAGVGPTSGMSATATTVRTSPTVTGPSGRTPARRAYHRVPGPGRF